MLLFKCFEKRAKDGLPDPNGPLSSRVLSDKSVGQPRGIRGLARGISAESAVSEGKKHGLYNQDSQ